MDWVHVAAGQGSEWAFRELRNDPSGSRKGGGLLDSR